MNQGDFYHGKHLAIPRANFCRFQRFIEIWTAIPSLYLLLIISAVLPPGFFILLGILLLFSWVSLVGLVRAEFLRGRKQRQRFIRRELNRVSASKS